MDHSSNFFQQNTAAGGDQALTTGSGCLCLRRLLLASLGPSEPLLNQVRPPSPSHALDGVLGVVMAKLANWLTIAALLLGLSQAQAENSNEVFGIWLTAAGDA